MKILVTGSEGFIGSHLVEMLIKKKNIKFERLYFITLLTPGGG